MTKALQTEEEADVQQPGSNFASKAVAALLCGALALGTFSPEAAEAARSGGRVGGRAFSAAPRAAPRTAPSTRTYAGNSYTSNTYVAPPIVAGGYGYGYGMSPFGFSPFGFSPFGFGFGGGGAMLQLFLGLFVIQTVLSVVSSVMQQRDDGDKKDDFDDF